MNKAVNDPQYIGHVLLQRGFKDFTRYMFKVIEGNTFHLEQMHDDLFAEFEAIYNGDITRSNINLCPRVGKTTLAKYFLAFCLAKNPKCNFIYTSYSQSLLGDISRGLVDILEHPVYKAMFSMEFAVEDIEDDPVSQYWREYLHSNEKKASYSSKKIVTPAGGVLLFSSIGASITGYGCSIKGAKGFTGALILDDSGKPADIHSEKKRKNVHTYYDETLLSRLNNSDTPVINIQQRLHVDDLTGYLNRTYKFKTLAKPLLVDGVCQLPKQYTQERIEELQQNQYMFNAQYQQEPYKLGGDIFKDEYWNYYDALPQMQYYKIYADTATKTKEYNDFSVLQLWGKSKDGKCYLVDQLRGKWEAYDLEVQTIAFWNKHKPLGVRALCIEDASSGTGLIQNIRRKNNIPVEAISRQKERKDKLTRAMDTVPHIVSGNVFIPSQATWLSEYVAEFSAFTADDSHAHDDQIDPTMDAISDMLIKERKVQSVERRLF